jgi:monoamine oxidase
MARTDLYRRVRRALRLAIHCESTGMSTAEALDRARDAARVDADRRRLLAAGAASALAVGFHPGRARAQSAGGVAIVGAGLAGLACGDALLRKGIRARIFEADERVGGRCWSLRDFFPGQVAERGGEFIDTPHVTMRGYAKALGLPLEDVNKEPGETFYFFGGRRYAETAVVDEFRALVPRLKRDQRLAGAPTADAFTEEARRFDLMTMREYLDGSGAGALIKAVLDAAYTIEYGADTDRQSSLALLGFLRADRRSRFEPFGVSDERFHVIGGNDAIATGLAARMPGQIELGHRLVAVRKLSDGRIRLSFSVGSRTVESDHDAVVLTLPFTVLRDVHLDASLGLPAWKRFAIDNVRLGDNSKLMAGFRGRYWLNLYNSRGSAYGDLPALQNTWETNPARATGQNALLTDYTGGTLAASLDPAQTQAETQRFLGDLDRVYPGAFDYALRRQNGQYLSFLENWTRNPFTRGAYTVNQPGYFTTIADNEAKPVGNLLFAGETTSSFYEWQGFMEGACLSGLRAAAEARALLLGR